MRFGFDCDGEVPKEPEIFVNADAAIRLRKARQTQNDLSFGDRPLLVKRA